MDQKRTGWILVVVGAALLALSALADPIGLGDGDGIGLKQTVGMIVGGLVVLAGLAVVYVRRGHRGAAPTGT